MFELGLINDKKCNFFTKLHHFALILFQRVEIGAKIIIIATWITCKVLYFRNKNIFAFVVIYHERLEYQS